MAKELQIYELVLMLKNSLDTETNEKIELYRDFLTAKGSQVMVQNSQADDLAGVTVHCFVVTPITINDSINIVAYVQANLPQGTTYVPTFDISLGEGSTKLFISKLK